MVCGDRGYALCEIEVGWLQYRALSVFLSGEALGVMDNFVRKEDLISQTHHESTL